MKLGATANTLLEAAALISIVCGLILCGVNSRFVAENSDRFRDVFKYRPFLQAILACGIFGVLRAVTSLATVIVLTVPVFKRVPAVVPIVLAAASAGLYIGEVIPGGMAVRTSWTQWQASDNNLVRNADFRSWVAEWNWRKAEYGWKDPTGDKEQVFLVSPLGDRGYSLPDGCYYTDTDFGPWGSGVPYCLIDHRNTTWPEYNETTNRYEVDEMQIVAVKCAGGWNQDNLNAAVKKHFTEQNEKRALEEERENVTTAEEWDSLNKKIEYGTQIGNEYSIGTADCILLIVESTSFVMTVVGLALYIASGKMA